MADGGGERTIERLKAGAGTYACGGYLAGLGALQRTELLTALLFDRLGRKIRRVGALLSETSDNWNETFYRLYFRTLGDSRNQEAYLSLARRVPYRTVLRERLAPQAVEAMLFGASGLLALYRHDAYTLDLGRHFEYLSAKYGIEAMDASEWTLADIRPANHPALRIAQAARFFAQDEFVMARAMACRTEEDIRRLFCIEASPYWRTHYVPGAAGDEFPKRLGAFKARIIGINLVGRTAIRLRQPHGRRTAARQRAVAPRAPSLRGQPFHAGVERGGRPDPQRIRIAGAAATGHGVLRPNPVRGVSRRAADRGAYGHPEITTRP